MSFIDSFLNHQLNILQELKLFCYQLWQNLVIFEIFHNFNLAALTANQIVITAVLYFVPKKIVINRKLTGKLPKLVCLLRGEYYLIYVGYVYD